MVATVKDCFQTLITKASQNRIMFTMETEDDQVLDMLQCFYGD